MSMSMLLVAPVTILGCFMTGLGDTIEIEVGNTYYDPEFVFVEPGDLVRWTRVAGTHDVTSGESCGMADGLVNSGVLNSTNTTFEWTVPSGSADVIEYYCSQGGHCVNGNQFGALLQGNGVTHEITTNGFSWDPPTLTVDPGDMVIWKHGGGTHTVTFGADCVAESGGLNEELSNLNPLVFWTVPDAAAGTTQSYFCSPHCSFGMVASIDINEGGDDCPTDTNGDNETNVDDLLVLLGQYGSDCSGGCSADVNDDGEVNVDDLLELLNQYGQPC